MGLNLLYDVVGKRLTYKALSRDSRHAKNAFTTKAVTPVIGLNINVGNGDLSCSKI